MTKAKPRITIKDPKPYKTMLQLAERHGVATALTGALHIQCVVPDLTDEQAYKRANYALKRLESLKLMLRKRIEGIDCFAITAKGCKWLADQLKKDVSLFKSTTETLRPTKAGNLNIRHRLVADCAALFTRRDFVRRGKPLGTLSVTSERRCVQASFESMRKKFGKRPDGYLKESSSGRCVVIEVERSRRNSDGWYGLMQAMRNYSGHGDPSEIHAGGWLFVVHPDCQADIIRNITNEFGYDKFQHFSINDAHLIAFNTGVFGSKSLINHAALCSVQAMALIVPLDVNGPVMNWVSSLASSNAIPYFSLNVFSGGALTVMSHLAEIVQAGEESYRHVKLVNQVFRT